MQNARNSLCRKQWINASELINRKWSHQPHQLLENCELSKTIMKVMIPNEFFQNQNFYGNLESILKWLLLELALMPINKNIHILCVNISFKVHL